MANALSLYGIVANDHHLIASLPEGTELVPVRELAAIVGPGQYASPDPDGADIEHHQGIVGAVFARTPVLPAPVGTVFRTRDTLLRWLELHYVALSEALHFVDDRAAARVHVFRADGKDDERDAGSDLAAVAADTFRTIRRHAVAALPLKSEHLTGIVLSSAFLVEKELWSEFEAQIGEQRERNGSLQFKVTGPWPPFDFIRMQFGG